jgi:hypothetical protein
MIERATMTEPAVVFNGGDPHGPTPGAVESLEQRVTRLEHTVAVLQDTQPLEDRIAERVTERVNRNPPLRESTGILIDAGRRLLPSAVGLLPPPQEPPPARAATPPQHSWLLLEALGEARAMIDMYLDPRYRYRLTWVGRVVPAVLLLAIATTWIWLPGTAILPSFLSGLLIKVVDLVLAFFLFKVLAREARRYRELVPHVPATHPPGH